MDILNIIQNFIVWSHQIADTWGYFGIFLVNVIASATIIMPIPSLIITFTAGAVLNPVLVGLVAALGSTIGELTGYAIGVGGSEILEKKNKKWVDKTKKWSEKRGMFLVIFLFAITPLPDDIVGILAGIVKYDIKKFFIASFIGKAIINIIVATAGYYGIAWILATFGV